MSQGGARAGSDGMPVTCRNHASGMPVTVRRQSETSPVPVRSQPDGQAPSGPASERRIQGARSNPAGSSPRAARSAALASTCEIQITPFGIRCHMKPLRPSARASAAAASSRRRYTHSTGQHQTGTAIWHLKIIRASSMPGRIGPCGGEGDGAGETTLNGI